MLLARMQAEVPPVKPAALGRVPEAHYRAMAGRLFGVSRDRCWYARKEAMYHGVPWSLDVVVAATQRPDRVIYATNFGVCFGDPLAGADLLPDDWTAATGAASFLRQVGAYPDETNGGLRAAIIHVQCAAPWWTDTGKVQLIVPPSVAGEFAAAFTKATKALRAERDRARKDAAKEARRQEREDREWEREQREPPLKETVGEILGRAPESWEGGSTRALYDWVVGELAGATGRELKWFTFRSILRDYQGEHGPLPNLRRPVKITVDLSRHPRGPEELQAAARQLGRSS